jgi:hypothetical protein
MDTKAVQSDISSLREITITPQPVSATAPNSFETHLANALNASASTLDSKLPLNQNSSKAKRGVDTSRAAQVPTASAGLLPVGWNAMDVWALSPASNPSSPAGPPQSPDFRSAPWQSTGFEPTVGSQKVMGSSGNPGVSAESQTPTARLSEHTADSIAPKASDHVANQTLRPGLPGSESNAGVGTSQTSGSVHNPENPIRTNGSLPGTVAEEAVQMERALASLEGRGVAVLAAAPSAEAASTINPRPSKVNELSFLGGRGETATPISNAKTIPSKPSESEPSQIPGKGPESSDGNGLQANSGQRDSQEPAKGTTAVQQDDSRSTYSQDSSSKLPGSTSVQAPSAGNAAGNASAGGAAAQVMATGFPQSLNQSVSAATASSHAGASTLSTASQPGAPDKIAAALDSPTDAVRAAINSASLVQSQGKAEMHVAMQTDALGALQLHAVLDNGKVGASIQVVTHDAHTVLTNDLPALQQVLKEQNLKVDHLAVINSPMPSGAGSRDGRNFQSEDFSQSGNQNTRWPSNSLAPVMSSNSVEALPLENHIGRLSVRA